MLIKLEKEKKRSEPSDLIVRDHQVDTKENNECNEWHSLRIL